MGIFKAQLEDLITRTLKEVGWYSPSAVKLLLMTAAQESHMGTFVRQLNGGPALGVFQMEGNTHDDIWENYLAYREERGARILEIARMDRGPDSDALEFNLKYAVLMARAHYRRVPVRLPEGDDIKGLAEYWKKHYNTVLGSGTVSEAVRNYERFVLELQEA